MRSLSSPDLIQLPRLGSGEAVRLIAELLAVAGAHAPLPAPIERSRQRLSGARAALQDALAATAASSAPNPGFRRIAEQALDAAWEATFDWLSGWCKLAEEANPHRAAARALFVKIFAPSGPFAKQYKVEYDESRSRLDAIERDGHEATFHALGGAAFLAHLRAAQRLCEKALSPDLSLDSGGPASLDMSDAPAPTSQVPTDVRVKLADAAGALRQYLMRIVAHVDPEVPGSDALAEALMRPLVAWHQRHPSRGPESEFGSVEETRY